MDEHQRLVNSLIVAFQKEGYTVQQAVGGSYQDPYKIGKHEPDIIARNEDGLIIVGEAKTIDDISSERSKEQYLDFSDRVMSEGILRGKHVPLHIIVPRDGAASLRQALINLGISNKIGNTIFIWAA